MTTLNDNERRAFIAETITITTQETATLTAAGFDPATRLAQLQTKADSADEAEAEQQRAEVAAKNATKAAQDSLKAAYDDASSMIDLFEGLLGKKHTLVLQLRQLRKR